MGWFYASICLIAYILLLYFLMWGGWEGRPKPGTRRWRERIRTQEEFGEWLEFASGDPMSQEEATEYQKNKNAR